MIITVIVLLILAGTAVSIAINGGDIFNKANQAREGWNVAVAEENAVINNWLAYLDQYAGSSETLPEGWNSTYVTSAYPSNDATPKAPIPKGYKASIYEGETTIAGGLVIYETNELIADETGTTNHDYAMEHYNQYVWIPVTDINDMVMCTKSGTAGVNDATACDVKIESGKIYCATHMTLEEAENKESTTYLCR